MRIIKFTTTAEIKSMGSCGRIGPACNCHTKDPSAGSKCPNLIKK